MGISTAGVRDIGSGTAVGGYLRLPSSEHGCTVHCHQVHYLPVSVGGADTRYKGIQVVVGRGRVGCGRDTDGSLGGGTDGGGEETDGTETDTD